MVSALDTLKPSCMKNIKNLKSLFDRRINDDIDWVLKEEQSGTPKHIAREPNVNDTFKLFLKPFEYLYNASYLSPEIKAQYRQEAIDQGLLSAPAAAATAATATSTRAMPSTGTYA